MSLDSGGAISGLRVMLGGITGQPKTGAIAIVLSMINGASMVAGAWAIGWATEHFVLASFQSGRPLVGAAWFMVVAILGVSMFRMVTILFRGLLTGQVQFGAQAGARRALTRRLLDLDPSWHRRHRPGTLMSTMVSDVDYTWQAMNLFPFAIGMAFMLAVAAVRIVLVDPVLAIIALVLVPLVFGTNLLYQRALGPRARLAQEERARLTEYVHESVAGRQVIRTAGLDAAFDADFTDRAERLRLAHTRLGAVSASFEPIIELLPSAAMLGLLAVGAMRLDEGAIDIAQLVEFVYLLQTMTIPLNIISRFLAQLPLTRAGASRIRSVLDAQERTSFGDRELDRMPHAVSFVDVKVRHGEHIVLDLPALEIARGSWIAVAGDIGAGKTTFARLLVRAHDADEGSVRIDDVDVRDYAETELGGSVALVSQEPVILRGTIRTAVALDRPLDDGAIDAALHTAVAETFVREGGGLESEVAQGALSGGQRQRLAIARAIARNPGLLVLDDATAALDTTTERELVARLREYRSRTGTTLVTTTNHVRLLQEADAVVLLDAGRIAAVSSHDDLVASLPRYRALLASGRATSS